VVKSILYEGTIAHPIVKCKLTNLKKISFKISVKFRLHVNVL